MGAHDDGDSNRLCCAKTMLKRGSVTIMNGRTRSASLGRDKKSDLRARYWAFLFENLQHAVDELYQTCETDENISECKEVILVLENYTREFHNLTEWFRVKWEYENTPPPQRPNSLAWEIRKSSPGKLLRGKQKPRHAPTGVACRELLYELNKESDENGSTKRSQPELSALNRSIQRILAETENEPDGESDEGIARKTVALKVEANERVCVDNSSQTIENLPTVATKKPLWNAPRKPLTNSGSYSCTKKLSRNLNAAPTSLAETKTPATPCKRSICASPKKPVPGRNIDAREFVPSRKTTTNGADTDADAGAKQRTVITSEHDNARNDTSKTKVLRSQSDSVFVTATKKTRNTDAEAPAKLSDDRGVQTTKFVSTPSFDVSSETKVPSVGRTAIADGGVVVSPSQSVVDDTLRRDNSTTTAVTVENKQENGNAVSLKQTNERPTRIFSRGCKVISRTSQRPNEAGKRTGDAETPEKHRPATVTPQATKSPFQFAKGRKIVPSTNKAHENVTARSQITDARKGKKIDNGNDDKRSEVAPINYVAAAKRGESQNHCKRDGGGGVGGGQSRNQFTSMTRSKTSADIRCKYTAVGNVGKEAVAPSSSPSLRNGEDVESPPRHRRSSKGTDGWETVISRSRRSIPTSLNAKNKLFDVNNRFREPSSSTSLPTLVMLESDSNVKDKPQTNDSKAKATDVKNKNRHRNNSHTYAGRDAAAAHTDAAAVATTLTSAPPPPPVSSSSSPSLISTAATISNESTIVVSPSDRDYDTFAKERPIISSTAMFTTIQAKKKKTNEKDVRKVKISRDAKNATKRKCGVESEEQNKAREDLLDEESLRKSKELYEKEISLQKEISDLQNDVPDLETDADADADGDADAEVDVDSDSTEVDQEIVDLCESNKNRNAVERRAALEAKYNHILANMSWAEQVETLDKLEELLVRDPSGKSLKFAKNFTSLKQFEDLMTRAPGRALELHQKLSSPSRKRVSPDSTILQHKARQAKAKQNREQLLQDKSAKIRELFNKVAEVKVMQAQLANERRKSLEQKLKRAEENRNLHLKNIQEKAHDEAKKQKEIAFINELEAQNKRHDFYALRQEQEDRFQSILEERQRRQEEKAAKEAAAEERRKAIEAERQEKIEELQQKMRKREERIDRELQEKERVRIKMAREKARDREDRLLALQAAQIANAEELQKKIQQKQENSARRHEENIELIRQKAIEIGTPRLTPYQINKLCSVCNVVIDSEVFLLSHLKGKSHQEAIKKYREQFEVNVKFSECSIITDAPADVLHEKRNREKERQRTLRKRCKKIRHRLLNGNEENVGNVWTAVKDKCKKIDSSNKGRILKSVKEVDKVINTQGNGVWPNNAVTMLERNLFEVIRILERGNEDDQRMFKTFDGFAMLSKIYNLALDLPKNMSPYLPLKCFVVTSNLFAVACRNNVENCLYVLFSNGIVQILDLLLNRLNLIMPNSDDRNGMVVYKADTVADVLMNLCSNVLSAITSFVINQGEESEKCDLQQVAARVQDVVSYVVCTGIVDKLAVYCSSVHDNKSADSYFLLHCMELLTRLVETRRGRITDKEDCTQLMATLKATELVGAVSMLYAMLLHRDSISNDNSSSVVVVLPPDVVNVIIATLRLFSKVGELNLKFFQNILGAEGISLQVRHIISYLLRYCTQNEGYNDLLHQVIEFIGFFAIHHTDNQMILQSGSTPTVLQQLSSLPFSYFSNPTLVRILFPTLLACCVGNPQNRAILDQEVSFQLLEDFRNAEDSNDIPLIRLLQGN